MVFIFQKRSFCYEKAKHRCRKATWGTITKFRKDSLIAWSRVAALVMERIGHI